MLNRLKNIYYLSLGHFANDLYPGMLSPLLPVFIDRYGWSITQAGILITVMQSFANLSQPVFGIINDKWPSRKYIWLGLLIAGFPFLFILNISSINMMMFAMAVTGIGVGMYHPVAVVAAGMIAPENRKGFSMAIFTAGGQISFMLAPLIAVLIFEVIGEQYMPLILIPAIAVALYFALDKSIQINRGHSLSTSEWLSSFKGSRKQLTVLWLVSSFSSIAQMLINSFLPMFAIERGSSYSVGAYFLSASLFASMVGTFIGGHFSDIHGRKKIMVTAMFLSFPFLAAFLYTHGILSLVFLLIGICLLCTSIPIGIIIAQRTTPKLAGMASSLVMGLSYATGAIAATPFGALADKIGIEAAMNVPIVLPLLGGLFALMLRSDS
jgi:MFS transporter, FSR family, fosmidomycin resistance protein